jgi:hypothetical protein
LTATAHAPLIILASDSFGNSISAMCLFFSATEGKIYQKIVFGLVHDSLRPCIERNNFLFYSFAYCKRMPLVCVEFLDFSASASFGPSVGYPLI